MKAAGVLVVRIELIALTMLASIGAVLNLTGEDASLVGVLLLLVAMGAALAYGVWSRPLPPGG